MNSNFSKAQGALRKFLSFQRQFATALYKMKYRAKLLPYPPPHTQHLTLSAQIN